MSCTSLPNCTSVIHPSQSSRPPILLILYINWCALISPFEWPCKDIVHFDRHWCAQNPDARDARLYLCWLHMRGASIFHTDAVEFIKCTQPRGALLSLGLVHFMLILWMQWYMKRGTLCAKAPDEGNALKGLWQWQHLIQQGCTIFLLDLDVPCLIKEWIVLLSSMITSDTHEKDMRRQHNTFIYISNHCGCL